MAKARHQARAGLAGQSNTGNLRVAAWIDPVNRVGPGRANPNSIRRDGHPVRGFADPQSNDGLELADRTLCDGRCGRRYVGERQGHEPQDRRYTPHAVLIYTTDTHRPGLIDATGP